MKQIHWKLSARLNDLVLREPGYPVTRSVLVFLDFAERGRNEQIFFQIPFKREIFPIQKRCQALLRLCPAYRQRAYTRLTCGEKPPEKNTFKPEFLRTVRARVLRPGKRQRRKASRSGPARGKERRQMLRCTYMHEKGQGLCPCGGTPRMLPRRFGI